MRLPAPLLERRGVSMQTVDVTHAWIYPRTGRLIEAAYMSLGHESCVSLLPLEPQLHLLLPDAISKVNEKLGYSSNMFRPSLFSFSSEAFCFCLHGNSTLLLQ